MFGAKSQAVAKRFEPLKSILDFGSYVWAALVAIGVTGAAMITWFADAIAWAWHVFGYMGLLFAWLYLVILVAIAVRIIRGLFSTWRGAVGLGLIAVSLLICAAGIILIVQDKIPFQHKEQASSGEHSQPSLGRPVFDLSKSDVDMGGATVNGALPPGFVKADDGSSFKSPSSTWNVQPNQAVTVPFPPPDGTFRSLSKYELSDQLKASAKKLRDTKAQSEWVNAALRGRSLASEVIERLKTIQTTTPGVNIQMIYVTNEAAAERGAKFLSELATEISKR